MFLHRVAVVELHHPGRVLNAAVMAGTKLGVIDVGAVAKTLLSLLVLDAFEVFHKAFLNFTIPDWTKSRMMRGVGL